MEKIEIYKFQLESIQEALRMTSNIHDSRLGETCFDRTVRKAYQYANNALEGKIDERVNYMRTPNEKEYSDKINFDLITDIDHRLSVIEDYASGEAGVEITKLRAYLNEIAAGKHKNGIEI